MKGIMVVETRPSDPRREDEYNKWYDETHLPEVCAIPGIVSARRYRARPAGTASDGASSPTYVAIYDIEADDVDAVVADLGSRAGKGEIAFSDVLEMDPPPAVTVYELVAER